jgi:hypothetical protein
VQHGGPCIPALAEPSRASRGRSPQRHHEFLWHRSRIDAAALDRRPGSRGALVTLVMVVSGSRGSGGNGEGACEECLGVGPGKAAVRARLRTATASERRVCKSVGKERRMSVGAEGWTADFILEESGVVVRAARIPPNRQTLNLRGRLVALALSLYAGILHI